MRKAGGRPRQEILQDYLWEKQLLQLVPDHFEQVVAAALLNECHWLKGLITNQVTLHLYCVTQGKLKERKISLASFSPSFLHNFNL